jgi:hypothetical protein
MDNFDKILSRLPEQAITYNSSEADRIKNPYYNIDFEPALAEFRTHCPALPAHIKTKKEAQNWVYNNISNTQFSDTSLQFRDSIYNLTVTFDGSESKDVLVTSLNRSLPNSQILMDYLDRKRIEVARRLQQDPDIQKAAQNWNTINNDEYKEQILQRVSNITLQTLLPNKDIEYPKVVWDETLPYTLYGRFIAPTKTIKINGAIVPVNYNFEFASNVTVHETIHHFQFILLNWGHQQRFRNIPDINRFVRILGTSFDSEAGAVRVDQNHPETFQRYRLKKNESMSWGFSLIGHTVTAPDATARLENRLERDMYTFYSAQEPRNNKYHIDMLHGAAIPSMPEDTHAGRLPRACIK